MTDEDKLNFDAIANWLEGHRDELTSREPSIDVRTKTAEEA